MTPNPYEAPKRNEHVPDPASSKYGTLRKTINLGCGALALPLLIYTIFRLLSSENRDPLYNAAFLVWGILSLVTSLGVAYSMWRVWRS